MPTKRVSCGRKLAQRQVKVLLRFLLKSVGIPCSGFGKLLINSTAKKLPLTASSTARSGGRPGSATRTGVDLNKQPPASSQPDSCNC